MKRSGWVFRKPFEGKLWPVSSKTHNFCPSEAKDARFQASLSSPTRRGTMPAQPSNGFLTQWPSQSKNLLGQNQRVFEIPTPTIYFIFHHGKKDAYTQFLLFTV